MSGEKQNNWKDQLAGLDNLPGELFANKSEAWEKLHIRLQPKRGFYSKVVYRVAAACLIVAMLIPQRLNKRDYALHSGTNVLHEERKAPFLPSPLLAEKQAVPVIVSEINIKKINLSKRRITTASKLTKDTTEPPVINGSLSSQHNIVNVVIPSLDTIINKTALVAKKKFRVVHLNELSSPAEESRDDKFTGRLSFYRKFTKQDVFSSEPVESSPFIKDLLKQKINPQN